jgi:hypothetical protein
VQNENSIFKLLERVMKHLESKDISYALAGGLAANLYRSEIRATGDLDFIIYSEGNIIKDGKKALKALGYEPHEVREADLAGGPFHKIKSKETPVCILTGRSKDPLDLRVDFLLHTLKWPIQAMKRSTTNFANLTKNLKVPCITVEDLILAKLLALDHNSTRYKDLDDIQSILDEKNEIDWAYILSEVSHLGLQRIPKGIEEIFPEHIVRELKRSLKGNNGRRRKES